MLRKHRLPLTQKQLAKVEGVDLRTVRRWVASGCPCTRRGGQGKGAPLFDRVAVTAWRASQLRDEETMVSSLREKLDARSRATVRRLRDLEGSHISREEEVQAWTDEVARVTRLSATFAADVTAAVMAGAPTVSVVREHIKRAAYDLLKRLAAGAVPEAKQQTVHTVTTSKTLRAARAQLAGLETLILNFRDNVAAGAYRPADAVTDDWMRLVNAFRQRMLMLPGTCGDEVHRAALLGGASAVEVVLSAALADAVAELEPRTHADD